MLAAPVVALLTLMAAPAVASTVTETPIPPTADGGPAGIASGPDGALWFTEEYANKIGRITTAGTISEFALPNVRLPGALSDTHPVHVARQRPRFFNGAPFGIASGPDRALWFTESGAGKIGRITTRGRITEFTIPTSVKPNEIALGPDRALWFTESGLDGTGRTIDKIGRITTRGRITQFAIPRRHASNNQFGTASFPFGIASGPDHALWFTESYDCGSKYCLPPAPGTARIGRITTRGRITQFALRNPDASPLSIASGPDRALWFTESNASAIGRITTRGRITQFALPNSTPSRIALGPDRALWFTEQEAPFAKIGRITTRGRVSETSVPTANSGPVGIASGPDRALWFTESGAGKIGRITAGAARQKAIGPEPGLRVIGHDFTGKPSLPGMPSHEAGGVVGTVKDSDRSARARDYAAVISWGDGRRSHGRVTQHTRGPEDHPVAGEFDVSGAHSYSHWGAHRVVVRVLKSHGRHRGETASAHSTAGIGEGVLSYQLPSKSGCESPVAGGANPPGCRGRKVESFGNVATARHVAIVVPGVGNDYANFDGKGDDAASHQAKNLKGELERLYPREPGGTAAVEWLGYDPPPLVPPNEFVSSEDAKEGGDALATFIAQLRKRDTSPGGVDVTVIGHSYGSIVAADAARRQDAPLKNGKLVFVGSPGVDASQASELGAGQVFAGANPNDLIPGLATAHVLQSLTGRYDAGIRKLLGPLAGYATIASGHQTNPVEPAFGAKRFSTAGACGHEYFSEHLGPGSDYHSSSLVTDSLANMARIITGRTEQLTPETRPDVPFLSGIGVVGGGDPLLAGAPYENWEVANDCRSLNASKEEAPIKEVQHAAGIAAQAGRDTVSATLRGGSYVLKLSAAGAQSVGGVLREHRPILPPLPHFRAESASKRSSRRSAGRSLDVLASGRHVFRHAGTAFITLHLTAHGRRVLAQYVAAVRRQRRRHARVRPLGVVLVFRITPRHEPTFTITRTTSLRP